MNITSAFPLLSHPVVGVQPSRLLLLQPLRGALLCATAALELIVTMALGPVSTV